MSERTAFIVATLVIVGWLAGVIYLFTQSN